MQRAIVDFTTDDEGHWVAMLACGHCQHVRHKPPFIERPWVIGRETRLAMLGVALDCMLCDDEPQAMHAPSPIDHVVITVASLERTSEQFERLGFTLTPRAQHPWGTANCLVQLPGGNFVELLEIDRPELIPPHQPRMSPPRFSFGAYNRDYIRACGEGFSMLVLAGTNAEADAQRFAAAGLATYAPFHFERQATLPDGRSVKVAFSLAFATHPAMPHAAFFTCHNRHPENFWRREFQRHANGAAAIREAVLVATKPTEVAGFLAGFTDSPPRAITGGLAFACAGHALTVLTPAAYAGRFGTAPPEPAGGPRLAAIVVAASGAGPHMTSPLAAAGVTIAWQPLGRPGPATTTAPA